VGLTKLSTGLQSLRYGLGGVLGGAASSFPLPYPGAAYDVIIHPYYLRTDASKLVQPAVGDAVRWIYEPVTGTWHEQATAASRPTLQTYGGNKYYLQGGSGIIFPMSYTPAVPTSFWIAGGLYGAINTACIMDTGPDRAVVYNPFNIVAVFGRAAAAGDLTPTIADEQDGVLALLLNPVNSWRWNGTANSQSLTAFGSVNTIYLLNDLGSSRGSASRFSRAIFFTSNPSDPAAVDAYLAGVI